MNHKQSYRLLFMLGALTLVCILIAASHRLMGDMIALGMVCCHALVALLPGLMAAALIVAARAVIIAALLIGLSRLGKRLWQTYRFIVRLQAATGTKATATPSARLTSLCTTVGLARPVTVLATPVPLAFCFGLLNPAICLSTGLIEALTDRELKAVLLHEEHHRRHYDPLRTLLADVAVALLFFLPAAAEWRNLFHIATELAADRHAVRLADRFSLAGALHKLLTHPLAMPLSATDMGAIRSFSATDARLVHLLDGTPFIWCFSPPSLMRSSLILILGCVMLQIAL